jgi:hypothetical protein
MVSGRGEDLRASEGIFFDPCLGAGTGVVDVSHSVFGV